LLVAGSGEHQSSNQAERTTLAGSFGARRWSWESEIIV